MNIEPLTLGGMFSGKDGVKDFLASNVNACRADVDIIMERLLWMFIIHFACKPKNPCGFH